MVTSFPLLAASKKYYEAAAFTTWTSLCWEKQMQKSNTELTFAKSVNLLMLWLSSARGSKGQSDLGFLASRPQRGIKMCFLKQRKQHLWLQYVCKAES